MEEIKLYSIENASGMKARVLNYGATVISLCVPDNTGKTIDVLLGYKAPADYMRDDNPYFNCTVGRYANRIANSQFSLKGKMYILDSGGAKHCLHSGPAGMHRKYWRLDQQASDRIVLSCLSPDGEGGFPGNLRVQASFFLTEDNVLEIQYTSVCDQPCPVSLTFHGYFNLGEDSIKNHRLKVMCNSYLETDDELIPTGEHLFTEKLYAGLQKGVSVNTLLEGGIQLDHCFESPANVGNCKVATLSAENLRMDVETNLPGLQIYTGNGLHTGIPGVKKFGGYRPFDGICLEAQYFPDAVNKSQFPSPLIEAGVHRTDTIRYRFY